MQEPEGEEMTENAREVLNKIGKATTDLIRKVIRDGMQTERMDITEETYKHNEYIILDVSWSQFSESNMDQKVIRSSEERRQTADFRG